jgi:predicted secreted Zn-dependent protease
MSIDERLEALTQTVELMAHMHKSDYDRNEEAHRRNEEAQMRNVEAQMRNVEAQRRNDEAQAKNQTLMAQVMESVSSLARIAYAHEQRITELESH